MKETLAKEIGWFHSKNSLAHITINEFMATDNEIELIKKQLDSICETLVPINVWRCFLQLFGGLGIMLLVVAILPLLGLGGVQLYKAETPGPMKDAKLTPRIAETARGLWGVYFVLSTSCFLAYRWAGMSWSDAFMHMSTTVSLGGLSSHDASLGYWDSPRIEAVAMVFMLLAGVSFARYFIVWRTRSFSSLWKDVEVRAYFGVLAVSIVSLRNRAPPSICISVV